MKLTTDELQALIDCVNYTKETWDADPKLVSIEEKLTLKLKEIKGEEHRLLSNSELKNIGM